MQINEKMKAEGINGRAGWGPSLDGDLFPYQTLSEQALEMSKEVPLMIGTVKNEFVQSISAGLDNGTEEQIMEYIRNQWKDKADAYLTAVKKAYPNDTKPSDLIDVDLRFRPGSLKEAKLKSRFKGNAPVYVYLFTWQSPVMDGRYKAWHCMELPFVFDNIARCEQMTGGGKEAYKLAELLSRTWIQFARTGNPNHKGLPVWDPYKAEKGNTMIFDNVCQVKYNHDKELMDLAH